MTHGGASPEAGRVRAHWVALLVLLLLGCATLALHGYVHHAYGLGDDSGRPSAAAAAVPAQVRSGGPVIDARGAVPRTAGPPARTIALTFDDGPDPTWTPQVLAVLHRYGVRATFFVVGSSAAEHPELLAAMVADGHDIGLHSLTHPDLTTVSRAQLDLELGLGQSVVVDATGLRSSMVRPPYSSTTAAVDNAQWSVITSVAADGYVTVLTTRDSRDWSTPGVSEIVRAATPAGDAGAVVLFHDGGGDRAETVAALERLIPTLQARGYRFATVGAAVGLAPTMAPVEQADRLRAGAVAWTLRAGSLSVRILGWLLLAIGALTVLRALGIVVAARSHARSRRGRLPLAVTAPVSILVPAYQESAGIEASVRSLVAADHPVEVVVIDDGSTDGTGDLVEALNLPNVQVVRQANAGKAVALNTGLAVARHDLVVMVDGDTVIEPTTVRRLVQPFADPTVGAVSGNAKVANRVGLLGRWQHIEYVVGFNLDRRLFDLARCMPTVPGAVGAFRASAVRDVGGVPLDTLAEDTDLTMALGRAGWRVVYEQRARAWTEAPASLAALWRQRYRWCYGTLQAMWKHRRAAVEGGASGRFGRRALGYLVVFQFLLPLLGPVVDVMGVYGLLFLDRRMVGLVAAGFVALQMAVATYAFHLDGERLGPLWSLPLQQLVYRQLMYLVVIQSVATAVAGTWLRWQRMDRYGSLTEVSAAGGSSARPGAAQDPARQSRQSTVGSTRTGG